MKHLFILVVFVIFSSVVSNAQIAVGGSFSFSTSGGSTVTDGTSTDKSTYSSFSFKPMGGYFVSENLLVGAELNLTTSKTKTPGTTEVISKSSTFGLTPFARYYAVRFNKLSIYGQAQLGLAFSSSKVETGSSTSKGPKTTTFSFSITPGLAYDLSEKIQLQAGINLANFGFSSSVVKDTNGDKDKTHTFGLGVNTNGIVNTGDFSIGAIIKL